MNEVSLHRGRNPSLTSLKCSVDGEFFTNSVVLSINKTLIITRNIFFFLCFKFKYKS